MIKGKKIMPMKLKIKRWISATILIICLVFCNTTSVSAALGVVDDAVMNLYSKTYTGSGYAEASTLYSNTNFTGVTKMQIHVENNSTKNDLKVSVYQKDAFLWFDSCVSSYTVPKDGESTWRFSTQSSAEYYVKFEAPSDFDWWIKNGN